MIVSNTLPEWEEKISYVFYIEIKHYLSLLYNVTLLDLFYPCYFWKSNYIFSIDLKFSLKNCLSKICIRIIWTSMKAKLYRKPMYYDILEIHDKCAIYLIHESDARKFPQVHGVFFFFKQVLIKQLKHFWRLIITCLTRFHTSIIRYLTQLLR